ncbi:hypothetical protein PIB30_060400 [Stylosanthes scabra]|uniref:Uncharacterized protein n=1 Tax=Stylosanthes scabra TaxID=79078 RepID=A0ABU6YL33_9FABA|nr:hypothetical protein [Stylosanthes scabra]
MPKVPSARRELTHRLSCRTRRLLETSSSMVPYERMSRQHRSNPYRPFGYFPHSLYGSLRVGEDPITLAPVSGAIVKNVASLTNSLQENKSDPRPNPFSRNEPGLIKPSHTD